MHISKSKLGFKIVTYCLVAILAGLIGFRLGKGLTWEQILHLTRQSGISQLARLRDTDPAISQGTVDFSLFWEVWSRLERDYVDPSQLDAQKMVYGAIAGMTSALGDPYTVFLPPETKQRLTEDLQGAFDGVGIQLGYRDNQLAVIAPLKNHPAEKAGVRAGDYILRIVDQAKSIDRDTVGMSAEEAVTLIRGQKGTPVTLTLLASGGEPRDVTLVRDVIEIPSVEVEFVNHNDRSYALITLSRFGDNTYAEWEKTILQIQQQNQVAGIILDVRNNPGGYLQTAIDIASDFIDGGVVVSQVGRAASQSFTTTRQPRLQKYPVVVLVNKGSASASEIVAGAIRDRRETRLIGEKTFGKGTVQDAQQLINGAGLNVTIARWLLPSGDSINHEGLNVATEAVDNPDTPEDEALAIALQAF